MTTSATATRRPVWPSLGPRGRKVLRYGIVAGALLLLIGILAATKAWQIGSLISAGKQMAAAGPPPEAVGARPASAETWERTLGAVGTIEGVQSVAVSAEGAGVVKRIHFDSGDTVKQGEVLVELDVGVERAQLDAARARQKLARVTAERSRRLAEQNAVARAQLDADEAQLAGASADLAALEAAIAKKTIRAPFAGRVGIREVSLGQYVAPGARVTMLDSGRGVFVDFTLPQEERARVTVGMPVRLGTATGERIADGEVAAISPTIDRATRSIEVRARAGRTAVPLRPGMFVDVDVVLPEQAKVVAVPRTAVVHASYGDSVFVVKPKPEDAPGARATPDGKPIQIAEQRFVVLGRQRGDFVAVDKGIGPEELVVSAGAFKLRPGAPIVVDNTVAVDPKLEPRPTRP